MSINPIAEWAVAKKELRTYLCRYLEEKTDGLSDEEFNVWWRECVWGALSEQQRTWAVYQHKDMLTDFDEVYLLRILSKNWSSFRKTRDVPNVATYCRLLISFRNQVEHGSRDPIAAEDWIRAFDAVVCILRAVGADKSVISHFRSVHVKLMTARVFGAFSNRIARFAVAGIAACAVAGIAWWTVEAVTAPGLPDYAPECCGNVVRASTGEKKTGTVVSAGRPAHVVVETADGAKQKVYLCAVAMPHVGQPYGDEARQNLLDSVKGQPVEFALNTRPDKFGRYFGEVFVDGRDFAYTLILEGNAWYYARYAAQLDEKSRKAYAAAQDYAKNRKLGLWDTQGAPVEPWIWKKLN